ncbi:exodeoxyribonuclease III [Youxingia wuxianensis]|uniref:Exodeoxyribonuclease III n=1 Tax=Youxingia wuxianensis TaxID=2763678 RepID=A0A926EKS0_9FIRM|nr:exodeoxyribonuclease III [Youxingia wuxianensis]MBC8585213.1 exodeoxyribonuclease III [Youxingia wuxianensis]
MKIVTWNVNGLRACITKGFYEYASQSGADMICLQETKMQEGQADIQLPGYEQYWNSAVRKGYSGTAVFTKTSPLAVKRHFDRPGHDDEGRVLTLEYEKFYLVNAYSPNAKEKLARIDYRMEWEDALREYLLGLDEKKPVIYCGDLNVAHEEIDLKNPKTNRGNAGFSDQERAKMTQLLESGFIDVFRDKYPETTGRYTWWSYRFNARANNAGWRIDYFIVSRRIKDAVKDILLRDDVFGSDHCPVELDMEL